jgi:hypothetical protein
MIFTLCLVFFVTQYMLFISDVYLSAIGWYVNRKYLPVLTKISYFRPDYIYTKKKRQRYIETEFIDINEILVKQTGNH